MISMNASLYKSLCVCVWQSLWDS